MLNLPLPKCHGILKNFTTVQQVTAKTLQETVFDRILRKSFWLQGFPKVVLFKVVLSLSINAIILEKFFCRMLCSLLIVSSFMPSVYSQFGFSPPYSPWGLQSPAFPNERINFQPNAINNVQYPNNMFFSKGPTFPLNQVSLAFLKGSRDLPHQDNILLMIC